MLDANNTNWFALCKEDHCLDILNTTCPSPPVGQAWDVLAEVAKHYHRYHGSISAGVCFCGVITNLLTIVVLTRPSMRTPTNFLLTSIAVADIVKMASYLIYTLYMNVLNGLSGCDAHQHQLGWVVFLLVHTDIIITSHTTSSLLLVGLALMRCLTIFYPVTGPKLCTMRTARSTLILVLVISVLFCSPNYFSYVVCRTNGRYWWFQLASWAVPLEMATFLIYGIAVKILASLCIAVLTALLIVAMTRANNRYIRLRRQSLPASRQSGSALLDGSKRLCETSSSREYNRSTTMLAGVAISFVATELPQGIINSVGAIDACFRVRVYVRVGDLMDTLVLLNSSINFILYCTMSAQFRRTFNVLLCPKRSPQAPQVLGTPPQASCRARGSLPAFMHVASTSGHRANSERRRAQSMSLQHFERASSKANATVLSNINANKVAEVPLMA